MKDAEKNQGIGTNVLSATRLNFGWLAFLTLFSSLATHDAHAGPILNDVKEQNGFILAELADGAFTAEHLLDLEGKTLTITPDGAGGFDVQAGPLDWDADFGQRVDAASEGFPSTPVTLDGFGFPLAGTTWNEVFVNAFGTVSFGGGQQEFFFDTDLDGSGGSLRTFGNTIIQRDVPVIAPLFHFVYGESDDIFVRQDADALLVTWSISEIHGDIFAFAAEPRINEFQLRLESDGTIRISYNKLELRDGLVGVFAPPECSGTDLLTSFADATDDTIARHVDITNASVEAIDQCALRFKFTFRDELPPEGDPALSNVLYRVWIDLEAPFFDGSGFDDAELYAGVGSDGDLAYAPSSQGVELVSHTGNELVYDLDLSRLEGNTEVAVLFDAADFAADEFNTTDPTTIMPPAVPERRFNLGDDAGFTGLPSAFFEPFHFAVIPEEWDLLCEVLAATGDRFDFIAFYTDFRFDDGFDFAGAPSSGPIGGNVTGIGEAGEPNQCGTDGELEVFQHYVSARTPVATRKGVINGYAYENFEPQMALLGHELAHRWLVAVEYVTVEDQRVSLARLGGHWNFEVHTPSPGSITESGFDNSPMNGNYWRDNGDGTFSELGSAFIFPPKAFSYVDLYLMGLLPPEEVPDFFVIDKIAPAGTDDEGNRVFSGQRIDVTVDDIIDEVGPRQPPAGTQTHFDLGMIGIVKPGQEPSSKLITRINGIGQAFEDYWPKATDNLSTLDSGTEDLAIDPNLLEGNWTGPDLSGEGIFVDYGPSLNAMFIAWFSFKLDPVPLADPPPMDLPGSGQRWLTALLEPNGNVWSGPLLSRQGGGFGLPETEFEVNPQVGEITMEFVACDIAQVDYTIDTADISGSVMVEPIEKFVNPDGFECESSNGGESDFNASNTDSIDTFGDDIEVVNDTVAVGAIEEDSGSTGTGGDQGDNSASSAGAAYVFTRSDSTWSQSAYFKASNTDGNDRFGAVSLDGETVVVGSGGEASSATVIGGNQSDNSADDAGAVDVFERSATDSAIAPNLLEGNWTGPDLSGEGIFVDYGPSLNAMFIAWFSFKLDPVPPADPPPLDLPGSGQRWLTALLEPNGNVWSGPLLSRQGGGFGLPETEFEVNPQVGEITMEFVACDLAQVDYTIDTADISGSVMVEPIEKFVNPDGFECESSNDGSE